jgi:hypothetical protein
MYPAAGYTQQVKKLEEEAVSCATGTMPAAAAAIGACGWQQTANHLICGRVHVATGYIHHSHT